MSFLPAILSHFRRARTAVVEISLPLLPLDRERPEQALNRLLDACDREEVADFLLGMINQGRVNGLVWYNPWHGVGCVHGLVDHLYQNVWGKRFSEVPLYVKTGGPLEQWVWDVVPGDTPATNKQLAMLVTWIDAWKSRRQHPSAPLPVVVERELAVCS